MFFLRPWTVLHFPRPWTVLHFPRPWTDAIFEPQPKKKLRSIIVGDLKLERAAENSSELLAPRLRWRFANNDLRRLIYRLFTRFVHAEIHSQSSGLTGRAKIDVIGSVGDVRTKVGCEWDASVARLLTEQATIGVS